MDVAGLRDRALELGWRPLAALLAIPLFALYFGGVVGGSVVQSMLLPGPHMGWLQQLSGMLAVGIGVAFLPSRRTVLAFFMPEGPWLLRASLVGLSIAAAGALAGVFIGDKAEWHGLEYFAYQATMPGLGEEMGFRGLVLGVLIAALAGRSSSRARIAALLVAAAVPFAALHILEQSGLTLAVLFGFALYAGIALGWVRLTTGSLVAAVLAHNVANVASGLLDNLIVIMRGG